MSENPLFQILTDQIAYNHHLIHHIGVEREFFLLRHEPYGDLESPQYCGTRPVFFPRSPEFLARMNDPAWTFELSACQVEHRTNPHLRLRDLERDMSDAQEKGIQVAKDLFLRMESCDVSDAAMPLDIFPDERYKRIRKGLSTDVLRAACMVAGTHIHIGVANLEHALHLHNLLVPHLDELCVIGDHSQGERLRIYKQMATNWQPSIYEGPEHFLKVSQEQKFATNLRNCWHLIRISRHGTVELRMFGATDSPEEILFWVGHIRRILGIRHT